MSRFTEEVLNPREAARRVFRVEQPTDQQVSAIISLLKLGAIKRHSTTTWNTTMSALAEYMAREEAARLDPQRRAASHGGAVVVGDESMSSYYRSLIRDYFLAVLLKQKVDSRSRLFSQIVVASQACLLVAGMIIIGLATMQLLKKPWVSPEQKMVQAWLEEHYRHAKLVDVKPHPTQPDALLARFTYQEGKLIHSQLKFTLLGGRISSVDSSD
jgi:hypothetical protein